MKKKYTLDFSIESETDRLQAVVDILDKLDTDPNNHELEQMADYILYGKDENGNNAVKRGEVTDENKRYNSFKRASEKNKSLEEILDNPLVDQNTLQPVENTKHVYTKKKPTIRKPKYDKTTGEMIDPGDSDIPGMVELWERIEWFERVVAANEGRIPFSDDLFVVADNYRLYQLRHQLIDLRRHQYYLKDAYKPTINLLGITPPQPQSYDWDSDSYYWISLDEWQHRVDTKLTHAISSNLSDYETRTAADGSTEVKWVVRHHNFDWENPWHVRCLIDYYSAICMQLWDKEFSWGRMLIYDFDRYATMCGFSPAREYLLMRKIDKATHQQMADELQEKFGLSYNENHISTILSREIPERIAQVAKAHRLLVETPQDQRKQCYHCKRWLPKDIIFFGRNKSRKDGWASNCKECEKQRRIIKGGQSVYDKRNKDTSMLEMPSGQT